MSGRKSPPVQPVHSASDHFETPQELQSKSCFCFLWVHLLRHIFIFGFSHFSSDCLCAVSQQNAATHTHTHTAVRLHSIHRLRETEEWRLTDERETEPRLSGLGGGKEMSKLKYNRKLCFLAGASLLFSLSHLIRTHLYIPTFVFASLIPGSLFGLLCARSSSLSHGTVLSCVCV